MKQINEDLLENIEFELSKHITSCENDFIDGIEELRKQPDVDIDELEDLGEQPEQIYSASIADRLCDQDVLAMVESVQSVLGCISGKHFRSDNPTSEYTAQLADDASNALFELGEATLTWHEVKELMKGEN